MQPLGAGEPTVIGPYRLLGRLGSGGMGRVYLARSEGGRTVAVKVVHPHFATDEEFRARFRREVDAARRVGTGAAGHRWSAAVLDADPEAAVPWVATAYVSGPSLTQAVAAHGPLPEHSVRALGAGLAEALEAVHGLGLVHRDVKPSNVLLALDGPRLIDFGIARATDGTASLTSTGVSVGSPGYMSPEQILGKSVTGAADVFSLGAVLAYAVSGESPFPGDSSAALLYKVVHEEPELGAVRGDLRELVAHCLAKDPSARPAPREVARRLAPDGAGRLVAAGWLPGPLVEEVSRAAVRLLDLEAVAPVRTEPVPFDSPPDPRTSGGSEVSDRRIAVSFTAATGTSDAGDAAGTGGTGAVRGAGRRGRKVSCTLALAVTGALAAVMVGGGYLLSLVPDGANDSASQGPPRPASSEPASDAGSAFDVPKDFIGTWKGPTSERSGVTHGEYTAVFSEGAKGEDVVRTTSSLSVLGVEAECHGVGKLVSGTSRQLRIEERVDPDKPGTAGVCTGGLAQLTFTLAGDDTLRFESGEEAAGTPTGTLTRQ
ncbi:serine/threonine-protein kinase [Streptomyces sp. NPDC058220]|uniref:serine/threonine-protein kinase n=1 Tax=Streptomyces sp. NPDC058220 TaxID=3346387 RepID=UPI0036E30CB2